MSVLARIIREPLVHFLVLGAALFVLFYQVAEPEQVRDDRIDVSYKDVQRLENQWQQQWRRSPTEQELNGLVESYIREMVLYREALAMGLDQDDVMVRRRLGQKLEFMFKDLVEQIEPEEQQLSQFLEENPDRYTLSSRITFLHVFLNRDARGIATEKDALNLLQQLRAESADVDPTKVSDRFLYPYYFKSQSPDQVSRVFGSSFSESLSGLKTKSWQGPVESSYGLHLVYIEERTASRQPSLEEIKDRVRLDVLAERRRRADETFYRELRQKYEIKIELKDGGLKDLSLKTGS